MNDGKVRRRRHLLPTSRAQRVVRLYPASARATTDDDARRTALIGEKDGDIIIDFGETGPWQWLAMTPEQAISFAETVLRRACAIVGARTH